MCRLYVDSCFEEGEKNTEMLTSISNATFRRKLSKALKMRVNFSIRLMTLNYLGKVLSTENNKTQCIELCGIFKVRK